MEVKESEDLGDVSYTKRWSLKVHISIVRDKNDNLVKVMGQNHFLLNEWVRLEMILITLMGLCLHYQSLVRQTDIILGKWVINSPYSLLIYFLLVFFCPILLLKQHLHDSFHLYLFSPQNIQFPHLCFLIVTKHL
ncbi:hypothetical protein QVD17_30157 [Tagetes erecta]|uniref:Uncharacterized protein n=1 Tax=Tagetes erecta TaxID=13708 RepID=A0AAD8K306_TARER|nr:hypothetical protein QVD17_30157 [Tagetes erecta]